jgi:mono/diheme cytochrome c family protein
MRTHFELPVLPVLTVVGALLAALPVRASAQAAPAALYSAAQAEEGKQVFEASCARCHNADLSGKDDAPPIAGAYFASSWGGQKVSALIEFVAGNMPLDMPATLDEASYVRVVAYVLSRNGVPAGDTPLAKGATGVITVAK